MKKYLFTMLVISFSCFGCTPPQEEQPVQPQNQEPSQGESPGQQEGLDPYTPEERERIKKLAACRKDPSQDGCACILSKSSLECQCSQKANADSKECLCFKNPNDPGCACVTNPNGEECYCSKNPAAERCQGPSVEMLCRRYCASSKKDREDKDNPLTKKLLDADCDHDGLSNRDELEKISKFSAQLDPCNEDTKGNGIFDNTDDPLVAGNDLDRDGVPDVVEERLGLLKDNAFTPFDGIFGYKRSGPGLRYGKSDSDLWIVNACEEKLKRLESVNLPEKKSHPAADIKMTLPADSEGEFFAPSDLNTRNAAMLFSSRGQGIFGGLLAKEVSDRSVAATSPKEYLSAIVSKLNPKNYVVGANAKTHDNFDVAQADVIIRSRGGNLQKVLFDALSSSLKGEGKVDLSTFNHLGSSFVKGAFVPSSSRRDYSLKLTVIYRKHRNDQGEVLLPGSKATEKDQVIFLYAFAPVEKSSSGSSTQQYSVGSDLVAIRLRDLTNTTSVTQLENVKKPICVESRTQKKRKLVYFYFVLDESGSMSSFNQALVDITNTFFDKVKNTELDFRVGVTHLAELSLGNVVGLPTYAGVRAVKPPEQGIVARWVDKDGGAYFQADVNLIKQAGGQTEIGFAAAENGLKKMTAGRTIIGSRTVPLSSDRIIQPDSEVITIWVSDEEDHTYSDPTNRRSSSFLAKQIDKFKNELKTTAFAIVAHPEKADAEESGYCYTEVAQGTGGGYGKLSSDPSDYLSTLDSILEKANSVTSRNVLPQTPISSSLQLFKDASYGGNNEDLQKLPPVPLRKADLFVPRSLENGFSYSAERNVISFTGRYKPFIPKKTTDRGEDFVVLYYFYDYKTKAF